MFVEAIIKFPFNCFLNLFCGVYLCGRLLSVIERSHIIQTGYMVFVGMGEDYCVESGYTFAQHLLAKIGSAIDYDYPVICFQHDAGAQALVAGVI
jgi:hypothetical protein